MSFREGTLNKQALVCSQSLFVERLLGEPIDVVVGQEQKPNCRAYRSPILRIQKSAEK
jgi:hypothetical protein